MNSPTEYTLKRVSDKQLMSAIAKNVLDAPDGKITASQAEELLCTDVVYIGDSVWHVKDIVDQEFTVYSDTELATFIRSIAPSDEEILAYVEKHSDHILIKKDDEWYTSMPTEQALGIKVGDVLDSVDGTYYQWLKPVKDPETGEQRYLHLEDKGDGESLSTLTFNTVEDAKIDVEQESWDYGPEDVEDCVLVEVMKRLCEHPFKE